MNVAHISSADNRYIVESMSGGAALFDCDNDGLFGRGDGQRFVG